MDLGPFFFWTFIHGFGLRPNPLLDQTKFSIWVQIGTYTKSLKSCNRVVILEINSDKIINEKRKNNFKYYKITKISLYHASAPFLHLSIFCIHMFPSYMTTYYNILNVHTTE